MNNTYSIETYRMNIQGRLIVSWNNLEFDSAIYWNVFIYPNGNSVIGSYGLDATGL